MSNSLEGKVALVAGGGHGVGLKTAQRLASEGAFVFITSPHQDELDRALSELGSKATGIRTRGAIPGELNRIYEVVKTHTGKVDIVYTMGGLN